MTLSEQIYRAALEQLKAQQIVHQMDSLKKAA